MPEEETRNPLIDDSASVESVNTEDANGEIESNLSQEGNEEKINQKAEKTFTQDDLNRIVAKEKAIERRKVMREVSESERFKIDDPTIQRIFEEHPIEAYENQSDWFRAISIKIAQETEQKNEIEVKKESFRDKVADAGLHDYEEVVLGISNFVGESLVSLGLEHPEGHLVLYELGKHPQEAKRISRLPQVLQSIEALKFYESKKHVKKEVSKAPEPITPLKDKGKTLYTDPFSPEAMNNLTVAEWNDLYEKRYKNKKT